MTATLTGRSSCPACGHPREGLPAPALPTTCSTAREIGLGDVIECGCTDPSHSERLVDDYAT